MFRRTTRNTISLLCDLVHKEGDKKVKNREIFSKRKGKYRGDKERGLKEQRASEIDKVLV